MKHTNKSKYKVGDYIKSIEFGNLGNLVNMFLLQYNLLNDEGNSGKEDN